MPFRQQVARIKQYLSNRGISARIGEIEDYVSPDLHYDINANIQKQIHLPLITFDEPPHIPSLFIFI